MHRSAESVTNPVASLKVGGVAALRSLDSQRMCRWFGVCGEAVPRLVDVS